MDLAVDADKFFETLTKKMMQSSFY